MALFAAARVLLDDRLVDDGWVATDGGRIVATGVGRPPDEPDVVVPDGVLAPGLIDLQVNGAYGHDFADADVAGWHEVARRLPETGVTAYVPTIITAPFDDLTASLRRYRHARRDIDAAVGARTLGMHVEAVFLSPSYRGAHRAEWFADPTPDHLDALLDAGGDALAYVTLAPERDGALAAVERLRGAGVRVSVGHSDATDDVVGAAGDAGASLVTHLYNAQRPLRHRDPGVVGAALSDARFTVGMIVDLHHVAPTAIRVAFAAAGGRLALVTDAIAALGLPPGVHHLGGEVVEVLPDAPPVRADGTLAGSVLRLDVAVANAIGCGIDPADALVAATRVPADALGRGDLGRIAVDAVADLVWFGDDWRPRATWVAGDLVHGATVS